MTTRTTTLLGVLGCIALLAAIHFNHGSAVAQSGSRGGGSGVRSNGPSGSARPPANQQPFEAQFWNWLARAQYKNWASLPGLSTDGYPGNSPHGKVVKLYANRAAAGDPATLPAGSILVKENYGPDGATLMAITVMYRSPGYNPDHGDWYWAKYDPNGRPSQMNGMSIAGKVGMCIDCHSGAAGDDYAFANDQ